MQYNEQLKKIQGSKVKTDLELNEPLGDMAWRQKYFQIELH